jgi:hypothetical protein
MKKLMKSTKIVRAVCLGAALAWGVSTAKAVDDTIRSDRSYDNKVERDPINDVTPLPEPTTIIAGSLLLLPFAAGAFRSRFWRK